MLDILKPEFMVTILVALATSGTFIAALKFVEKIYMRLTQKVSLDKELSLISKAYVMMQDVVATTTCSRVILFAGHNSGGVPRLGSPFYTTAIHSVYGEGVLAQTDYKELSVDAHYISMLNDTIRDGRSDLIVGNLQDSHLKDYYAMEGVTESVIFYLTMKDNCLYYISFATMNEEGFSSIEKTKLELKAASIARCLIKSYGGYRV